ncbi:hypothetical protein ACWIGF_23325 [Streptomyces diastaticus]|nr:hypothetical protein OH717_05860 [Streptomyces albidoflavus]
MTLPARDRAETAIALRLAHHSWAQVSTAAGFSNRTAARRAVQREIARREADATQNLAAAQALRHRLFDRGQS